MQCYISIPRFTFGDTLGCADFSKLPTQPGIPCGNVGFLTLLGVRCEGSCAENPGNEDFQKALAEIRLDQSPWIEMLAQGELGRNNAGRRAARASFSSSGSSSAQSSKSSSPGLVQIRVTPCMQAEAPATDSAGSLRGRRAKISRRGKVQSEYKQILVPFWTGQ